jgi:hypothetical protein
MERPLLAQSGRTPMRLHKLSANKRHRVAFGIRFKANYFGLEAKPPVDVVASPAGVLG